MDIRERFWTWWFDGIPQPVSDRMFDRVVNEEVRAVADRLVAENRQLAAALDAAQDEIERKIAQIEAVRIERDNRDAALSAVLKVHQRDGKASPYCKCGFLYEGCPTVRAVASGGAS